jgi:hypothetical protein
MADETIIDKAMALMPGRGSGKKRISASAARQKQLAAIQKKLATLSRKRREAGRDDRQGREEGIVVEVAAEETGSTESSGEEACVAAVVARQADGVGRQRVALCGHGRHVVVKATTDEGLSIHGRARQKTRDLRRCARSPGAHGR